VVPFKNRVPLKTRILCSVHRHHDAEAPDECGVR
jgi:hypothetical protein